MYSHVVRIVWAAVAVAYVGVCLWAYTALPDHPVTHFGADGVGDDRMSREANLAVSLALGAGLLGGLPLLIWALVRGAGFGVNIPHREYWLAPERIDRSRRSLVDDMVLFASLTGVFLVGIELSIVAANERQPPRTGGEELVLGAFFLIATIGWVVRLHRRYGTIPTEEPVPFTTSR